MRARKAATILLFVAIITTPLFVLALLGLQMMRQTVYASPGQAGPYGTRLNYGYFTGARGDWGDDVIPGGINSTNINQFVGDMRWLYYSSGNNQLRTGASFIINTMMGRNRPGNRNLTPAEINDWERLYVRNPNVVINFNENYAFCYNSYWQTGPRDDAWYNRGGGACWGPNDFIDGQRVGASITFRELGTGRLLYAIRRACGNPVGQLNMPGLPRADFAMSSTVVGLVNGNTSSTAEAGDQIQFRYTAQNGGPSTAAGVICTIRHHDFVGYRGTPPAWDDPGFTSGPSMGCPSTFAPGQSHIYTSPPITASANTTICRLLQVTPLDENGGAARNVACVTVYTKPYFRVYGGDVEAGASFTPCSASLPAGQGTIQAFNKGSGGLYRGSGTELAAVAYRGITEFVSASMRLFFVTPRQPIGLTFANNNPVAAPYGGNFGAGTCIPDYWSLSASPGAVTNNVGAGSYNVGGRSLGAGAKQDVFVDGDAVITGNIVYTGSWTLDLTNNTIPSFRLIVRNGNIYIRDTVTQLDGMYVAIPRSDGSKGLIYTCSYAAAPPSETQVASGCKQQLRVNGSLIAKGVKLLRTPNSLNNATFLEPSSTTRAGEIFTYSPDVWLAVPQFRFSNGADYDAITTLPPVL